MGIGPATDWLGFTFRLFIACFIGAWVIIMFNQFLEWWHPRILPERSVRWLIFELAKYFLMLFLPFMWVGFWFFVMNWAIFG